MDKKAFSGNTSKLAFFVLIIFSNISAAVSQDNSIYFPPYPIRNFETGYFSDIISADFNSDGFNDIAIVRMGASLVSIYLNQTNLDDIDFSSSIDFDIGAGSEPFCLIAADFDKDEKIDIITANHQSPDLSVLRNTRNGDALDFELTKIPNIPTFPSIGDYSPCLTTADFNGDSKLDLVIKTSITIGKVIVLKNVSGDGYIKFQAAKELLITALNGKITACDFDGDGKKDLAMYGYIPYTINFTIAPNISSIEKIEFDSLYTFGFGGDTEFVCGDFDNNGKVDIAKLAFGTGGTISFARNNSSPGNFRFTYEWEKDFPVGHGWSDKIHAVDLNNDNLLDLVVTRVLVFFAEPKEHNYISVLINKSSPGKFDFKPFHQFGVAEDPMYVISSDFDNDGINDLVIGHNDAASFAVLHNKSSRDSLMLNSAAIFPIEFPVGPSSGFNDIPYPCPLNGADFDGDGKEDLVIASWDDNSMRILKNISNPGKPKFIQDVGYSTKLQPNAIAIADFKNDQKQDIVISNESGSLSIYNNESTFGNMQFKVDSIEVREGPPISLSTGDFDLDEKIDLFVGISGHPFILRNKSSSEIITFEKAWSYIIPTGGLRMKSSAIADFNQDGLLDIAIGDGMSIKVHIFQNQTTPANLSLSYLGKINYDFWDLECIKTADLDGDGMSDLIIAWQGYPGGCSILRNISTQDTIIFADPITYQPLSNPSSLYTIDLTGDDKPDIIVGDPFSQTVILENKSTTGNINFEPAFPGAIILGDIIGDNNYYVADFDGDGFKDIAAPRSDQQEVWILRTSTNSFTSTKENISILPTEYRFGQNYPNPFNSSTIINFEIPSSNRVTIKIYDILGREVKILLDEVFNQGSYITKWDGLNKYGNQATSGVYFFRMESKDFRAVKKALLIK